MLLRLVKLIVVVVLLNALFRVGVAYWQFYQFRDRVQETAQFSAAKTDDDVHERVMAFAAAFEVPVAPEAVQVRRDGQHTYIDVAYVQKIELVPRMMIRPWPFKVNVEAWAVRAELPGAPSPR